MKKKMKIMAAYLVAKAKRKKRGVMKAKHRHGEKANQWRKKNQRNGGEKNGNIANEMKKAAS
jgi:hypothetical protein